MSLPDGTLRYRDRRHAARLLAQRLRGLEGEDPLILAVPRGGVPMGQILAEELGGELDVVLVHKLGAPDSPEYAVGSVNESGEVSVREGLEEAIPRSWIDQEAARQVDALRRRRTLYSGDRPPVDPAGRVVIVVDDGVATGATLEAALRLIRTAGPRRLIAAIAVAPQESADRLAHSADEIICPLIPDGFRAVGQYFDAFDPIGDEEVATILRRP